MYQDGSKKMIMTVGFKVNMCHICAILEHPKQGASMYVFETTSPITIACVSVTYC